MIHKRKLAIIGLGPRGGYALEKLIVELNNRKSVSHLELLLFEETGNFGNGHVYDLDQIQSNWVNISERILFLDKRLAIDIEGVQIPAFPSYHEWIAKDFDSVSKDLADTYPPRAKIGAYLQQRFQSFIKPLILMEMVSLFQQKVVDVKLDTLSRVSIQTNVTNFREIDEVLLTIGHQPTKISKQIREWKTFAASSENSTLFTAPYPIAAFLKNEHLTPNSVIGIRGFGLAMIDVVRAIANKFGKFVIVEESSKSCTYHSDHALKDVLIPFSLDGLPPSPKPINARIDQWFEPTATQIADFEKRISNTTTQQNATGATFLIQAFAPIAAQIYLKLPQSILQEELTTQEVVSSIEAWLHDDQYKHPTIVSHEQSVQQTLRDFVGMACGNTAVSLDYCIGQVWRHCQPSIYEKLSFNKCSEEVFAEIIGLDEGTKRYSYGPPVESIQQLLSLIDSGVMNVTMVDNPTFELTSNGWCFNAKGTSITADMMINSVLDPPKIETVDSPIVKSMLSHDLIEAVHDDLGVATDEHGLLISQDLNCKIPIALLGRLAKGTIIGVDAILECFGERPHNWAEASANRHLEWIKKKEL